MYQFFFKKTQTLEKLPNCDVDNPIVINSKNNVI